MSEKTKFGPRVVGAVSIGIAILMLIAGETVLKSRLSGIPMLCYWLACFVFTMIAAGAALLEAARVRFVSREEKRALIEDTIKDIERKKRNAHK